jgi:hypothetical protein
MNLLIICRDAVRHLFVEALGWLNALGVMLLLYVLQNPSAPGELLDLFPAGAQPCVKVLLPVVWFALVQRARSFDAKRKEAGNVAA